MNAIIPVWKPVNITSYDIIRKIKSIDNSHKVGHCGTLDPFAEGIVVICLGDSTKNSLTYMNKLKTYIATIAFGEETDTLDHTGRVIKTSNKKVEINKRLFQTIIKNHTGDIYQTPPSYSAKKINSIKLYDLARKDIFVKLKPSKIRINKITLLELLDNKATIKITCSKGTYIRALARDISYDLGTYGYLQSLARVSIGEFNKTNSVKYEDLENVYSSIR